MSTTGPLCVVTGATRGIGLAMATALAARGMRVVLVGRDAERLDAARATAGAHDAILADLATASGAATVIEHLGNRGEPIDVLLHNAGAIYPTLALTADGVERTFALNHLAPFRLTLGLLPLLRAAEAARVVTVSSEAHRAARRHVDDWQSARRYTPMLAYARSKLANILFTRALASRLGETRITANCFHPGVVRTEWASGTSGIIGLAMRLYRPFMRSAEQGAATGVYLSTSSAVAGVTGGYFIDEQPRAPSASAVDPELARSLWSASEALTGMRM